MGGAFKQGTPVVYRVNKTSTHPGPRARYIAPAPKGETYNYEVAKFWVVAKVLDDKKLVLLTRRGKEHVVSTNDPRLRPANLWERIIYRHRFPTFPSRPNGTNPAPVRRSEAA